MIKMVNLIKKLADELNKNLQQYEKLVEEFNGFQGKSLTTDNLEQVNSVLLDLQEYYASNLYPALSFIDKNYNYAKQNLAAFDALIENIKAVNQLNVNPEIEMPDDR